ncbi:MAG: hypothetical protein NZ932_00750 [Candidatus Bathyarchaeota archaeon]|nr:hypothetical protein [Candidatus Bathyarchaeota archaeon]
MRWKVITLTVIIFLIIAGLILYLRQVGVLGDLEALFLTIISALLSSIPSFISYGFEPRVALKIENVKFNKKQVNNIVGYYLTAKVLNKGKKKALNIDAYFDIRDDLGKPPSLLYVKTVETNGEKSVSTEIKPFDEKLEYVWVKDRNYHGRVLDELRHDDEFNLLFPHVPLSGVMTYNWETRHFHLTRTEYLLKLESGKRYQVKITVKGEDSDKNAVETTKKVKIKVESFHSQ